jgi:septal ring factor EnvC (AmiA/AmiB activator)
MSSTPESKLAEIKQRLDVNIKKAQQLNNEIEERRQSLNALTQPILEDQGALKALQELMNDTLDSSAEE